MKFINELSALSEKKWRHCTVLGSRAPKSPELSANAISPLSCREERAGKAQGLACHGRPRAALQARASAENGTQTSLHS